MHYHLEIIMPPCDDVGEAVAAILAPFSKNAADDEDKSGNPFWDWYVIGGRWSGCKQLAILGEDKVSGFRKMLADAGVTVFGLQMGKPDLSPADQIPEVDRLWREAFPDVPMKECPLFGHYKGVYGDVMTLDEAPKSLNVDSVIVAGPDYNGKLTAKFMIQESMWNGVSFCKTTWDATLAGALAMAIARMENYQPEYREKHTPASNWLVITVDYHS